jgi:AraC family transcriptional activator of pobA
MDARRSNGWKRGHKAQAPQAVPVFGLYGDWTEATVPGFVHAERIVARAPLYGWDILSHRHANLSQAFLVTQGGGDLRIEGEQSTFAAPWLLWIPSGVVHGFHFAPGTDGFVVTISDDFLASVIERDPEERRLGALAEAITNASAGSPEEIDIDLTRIFEAITREAEATLPGSFSAVGALLKLLLIGMLRTAAVRAATGPHMAERTSFYRRFRKLIEARFKEHWPVSRYAAELGVSTDRLHAICSQAVGQSPQSIVHDRLMLEAKRSLIYTSRSISEIAFDLGFTDPAYFSRFFAKRAAMSAVAYRASQAGFSMD